MTPHRVLLRASFLLILVALFSTVIRRFTNPRLALSAHDDADFAARPWQGRSCS